MCIPLRLLCTPRCRRYNHSVISINDVVLQLQHEVLVLTDLVGDQVGCNLVWVRWGWPSVIFWDLLWRWLALVRPCLQLLRNGREIEDYRLLLVHHLVLSNLC